jgi:UDP-3-O-[3-hydroxymyristoyl] N-acetylglucosamine deacetylase
MTSQQTLKRPIFFAGRGVHSGELSRVLVRSSAANTGFCFLYKKYQKVHVINASIANISDTIGATTLRNQGAQVRTVEHMLAALWGSGIDNAIIEMSGSEMPILDGSAKHFVSEIK